MAASENISCFLRNVRLLLKDIKKNMRLLLKDIKTMCSCFLELCSLKCFKVKQLKIKTMFMYFWLNYCDENHVERIPIAVKNINHLFDLATRRVESDTVHLFQGRI